MGRRHGSRSAAPWVLLFGTLVVARPAPAAPAPARAKVAVMELTAARGVDPGLPKLLDEELLTQLSERFDVLGRSDIASLLGFEQQKQMLGCADENTSCLAEIGGALGVRYMVTGSLGQLGAGFFISLKVLDAQHSRVLGRVSETVNGKEDQLIPGLHRALEKLLAKLGDDLPSGKPAPALAAKSPEKPGTSEPPKQPVAAPAAPAAPSNALSWTGMIAGGALVVGGAIAGFGALGTRQDIESNRLNPQPDGGHVAKDAALQATYSKQAWAANGLVGGGIVLGVVGFLLRTPASGAGGDAIVVPTADGLAVQGSFR